MRLLHGDFRERPDMKDACWTVTSAAETTVSWVSHSPKALVLHRAILLAFIQDAKKKAS